MCGKCEANYSNNIHWGSEVSRILLETCYHLETSDLPGKGSMATSDKKAIHRQGLPCTPSLECVFRWGSQPF